MAESTIFFINEVRSLVEWERGVRWSVIPHLLAGLKEYFDFYNFDRPHQSFSGKTPAEMYWG